MEQYGKTSGSIVDDVLHGEGGDLIAESILAHPSFVRSGRKWKGKPTLKKASQFSQDEGPLSITVAARGRYGYLYFPDDGSNTVKHRGGRGFMRKGMEAVEDEIIDKCVNALTKTFEEG